jgi:polygalacturonase
MHTARGSGRVRALGGILLLAVVTSCAREPEPAGSTEEVTSAAVVTPPPPPSPPLPSFPSRTCNVKDHDAEGDGDSDDTDAINDAIEACSSAGGGTVTFPSGTYMVASVRLRSNVRLLIQSGATIRGRSSGYDDPESNRFDEFQDFGHSHFRNAMMWGEGISNFAIEGPGKIDGDGLTDSDGPDDGEGDKQIACKSCDKLLFRNLTQTKGGHFFYLLTDCKNVTMENLSLSDGRDGINLVGCQNCEASNLRMRDLGDDAIPLKNDYSTGKRLLTENIYIHDCSLESGANGVQVGSETAGDFRNVWFENIEVLQAGKAGIGLQTNDGGILENFYIDNIKMRRAANPIYINSSSRLRTPERVSIGRVRNIFISNVTATEVVQTNGKEPANAATISGRPNIPHENITLSNVRITYRGGGSFSDGDRNPPYSPNDNYNPRSIGTRPAYGFFVRHARNLAFNFVTVDFESNDMRPAWRLSDVDGLELNGIGVERASSGAHPSLVLRDVRRFRMLNSPQFPAVDQANAPSLTFSPRSGTRPPTEPPPTDPPPTDPPPEGPPGPGPIGGVGDELTEGTNSGRFTRIEMNLVPTVLEAR